MIKNVTCQKCGEYMSEKHDIDFKGKYMTWLYCYECGHEVFKK